MPRTTSTDRDAVRPHHHHGRHRSSRRNESPAYSGSDSYSDDEPEPSRSSRSRRASDVNVDKARTRSRSRRQEVSDDTRSNSRGHSGRREKAGIATGAVAGAGAGGISGKVREKTGGLQGIKGTLINAGDIIRGSVGEIVDSTLGDEKGARRYQRMTDRGLQNLRSSTRSPGGTRIVPTGTAGGPPSSPHSQAQRDADMARSRADYEEGYRAGLNAAAAQMAQQNGQKIPVLSGGPPGYIPGVQHQIQPSYPPPQQIDNGGYHIPPAGQTQAHIQHPAQGAPPVQAYPGPPL